MLPIPCVDVLPYRDVGAGPEIELISRRGSNATVGWALVGGRVMRNECLSEAIARHLVSTLGEAIGFERVDTSHPLHAAEYSPDVRLSGRIDRNKHAIALAYVVAISGEVAPREEALDFEWFPPTAIPPQRSFAYAQRDVVVALLRTDARFRLPG